MCFFVEDLSQVALDGDLVTTSTHIYNNNNNL